MSLQRSNSSSSSSSSSSKTNINAYSKGTIYRRRPYRDTDAASVLLTLPLLLLLSLLLPLALLAGGGLAKQRP